MFDPDSRRRGVPPGALDDPTPDPDFWGADDRVSRPRRRVERGRDRPGGEARVALAVIGVVTITAALISDRASVAPTPAPTSSATVTRPATPGGHVVVQVAGAVTRPGVVEPAHRVAGHRRGRRRRRPRSRLADLDRLNLAAKLRDGEQVLVPVGTATTTTTTTTTTSPGTVAPPATG